MIGARRLAVIGDEPNKSPDSIIQFQKKVRSMQRKLLGEIYQSISSEGGRRLILEKFDKWLTQKILTEVEATFKSIGNIDQAFDSIDEKLTKKFKKLNMDISHIEFCDGMKLILQWYRILAIDAFLQTKSMLIDEIENKEYDEKSSQSLIFEKKANLAKKIKSFNIKLSEQEQNYSRQKNEVFEFNPNEWRNTFNAIVKEEKKLLSSPQLIFLDNERKALEAQVEELKNDTKLVVQEFKNKLLNEKEIRLKNQDLEKSDLDVYYVNEFAATYPIAFQNYKSLFTSSKPKKFEKIGIVESTIAQLKTPLEEFKLSLEKFQQKIAKNLKKTLNVPITRYQKTMQQTYSFLKEHHAKFTSPILILDKEYEAPCRYINDNEKGLAAIKREIENAYQVVANAYINQILQKPTKYFSSKEEAYNNFENAILQFAKMLEPSGDELEIAPLRLGDLYLEKMNASWLNLFEQYFTNELNLLKVEFNRIKIDKTDYNKEKMYQLREEFFAKKELLLREFVREDKLKQRVGKIFSILNNAFANVKRHPLFTEIEDYFLDCQRQKELNERKEQLKITNVGCEEKKELLGKPVINPDFLPVIVHRSISIPYVQEQKPLPKLSKIDVCETMPLWQRMVVGGLTSLAWMAIAFTIWGLLLEITFAVTAALVAGGFSVGVVTFGIFSYSPSVKEEKSPVKASSLGLFANKKNVAVETNVLTNQTPCDSVLTY